MNEPTDEELNVAVCEWLGWKLQDVKHYARRYWLPPSGGIMLHSADVNDSPHLPSYITGLEALRNIHEAEKRLDDNQYNRFHSKLSLICANDYHEGQKHWCADPVSATARQRTIALLRVVRPELFQRTGADHQE